MSFESEIERFSGMGPDVPLTAAEALIYEQLRNKRVTIALEIVPPALRDEFSKTVFPDRNVKLYARALYRNREVHSKDIIQLLTAHMRASLASGGFGQKLQQRGIQSEDILFKMMAGI